MPRKRVCTIVSLKLFYRVSHFNILNSFPFRHLLGKRALRAIGIVLHAEIFVNLEQALLVARPFSETVSGVDHFRKDASHAVSSRRFDNFAGSFAYSAQASMSSASQNGNRTLARISATRDSPISAILFADASDVSV